YATRREVEYQQSESGVHGISGSVHGTGRHRGHGRDAGEPRRSDGHEGNDEAVKGRAGGGWASVGSAADAGLRYEIRFGEGHGSNQPIGGEDWQREIQSVG